MKMKTKLFFKSAGILLVLAVFWVYFYRLKDQINQATHTEHARLQKHTKDVCKGSWVDKYKYYHNYSVSLTDVRSPTRFLVYWCGGHSHGCGGFGNRMYGILSMFYLAMLTNRVFLIHWEGPERFEKFLKPNQIDWTYRERYFKEKHLFKRYWGVSDPSPGFDSSRIESEENFWLWVSETADFDVLLSHQVEKIGSIWYFAEQLKTNPLLKERWRNLGLPMETESFTLIGCAFDFLFRNSPYMEREIQTVKSRLKWTRPIIGIHIRTSDLHWGNSNIYSVRTRSADRVLDCCKQIDSLLQSRYNSTDEIKWFLAADDADLKTKWLNLLSQKVIIYSAIPKHMEFAPTKATITNLLIDMFLLRDSDFLIGTRDSTFSNIAIGLGKFSANDWVYGEYCDDIDIKIANDHHYVYNKTFIKNLHVDRFSKTS